MIAKIYNNTQLIKIVRVLGIIIVISAMKNVQQAYVSKHMLFKKFFFSTIGGTFLAAFVGIYMAYAGYGVWALVVQQITNIVIGTLVLWITVDWKPVRKFSYQRLKILFSYGWKLLISSLINTLYDNIRQLVIGKVYSSSDLAYYNKGQQFPNLAVNNINASIDSVLLPIMSSVQEDKENVKIMTRKAIKTSSYFMWPIMMGLCVVAEPLIRILLTDKWLSAVPFLRIFCVIYAFQPIQTSNLNAIKAVGRSDLFLKLEIVKKSIGMLILFVVFDKGVMVIAESLLLYAFIAQVLNSQPNKKLLNYSYIEQLRDIIPFIVMSLIMAGIVHLISFLNISDVVMLLSQVIVGAVVYTIESYIMKIDIFMLAIKIFKKKI